MQNKQLLKKDLFGAVWRIDDDAGTSIVRDTGCARWWLSWLARRLLNRETRALAALQGISGVPEIISSDSNTLVRTYLSGTPMYEGKPSERAFFIAAARLLRQLHTAGVAHNDLAKEPNILVLDDGSPAFIDFQLASVTASRGRLFKIAAREDIRHLLKHKRSYRPDLLTARERAILAQPSIPSRLWMATVKPAYLFVTRRLLGWADREGAEDRGRQN